MNQSCFPHVCTMLHHSFCPLIFPLFKISSTSVNNGFINFPLPLNLFILRVFLLELNSHSFSLYHQTSLVDIIHLNIWPNFFIPLSYLFLLFMSDFLNTLFPRHSSSCFPDTPNSHFLVTK